VAFTDATPFDDPIAVIPLKIKDSVIGVISINKLLEQKRAFTTMDHELFTLLAGHAATADLLREALLRVRPEAHDPAGLPGHAEDAAAK
jgi:hypothetical protein